AFWVWFPTIPSTTRPLRSWYFATVREKVDVKRPSKRGTRNPFASIARWRTSTRGSLAGDAVGRKYHLFGSLARFARDAHSLGLGILTPNSHPRLAGLVRPWITPSLALWASTVRSPSPTQIAM